MGFGPSVLCIPFPLNLKEQIILSEEFKGKQTRITFKRLSKINPTSENSAQIK